MSNVLQIPNKNSALSASYSAAGKAASTSVTVPKILTIDTLTVKSIILLDSLFTKNDIDVSAINKLQISKGSIINTLVSPNASKKALTFNNVYFEPDQNVPDIMTIYGLNDLNIGTTLHNLSLYGSNVSISSNNINIENIANGNIVTNYIGANIGKMQFNPNDNEFQYFNDVQIFGNLEVQNQIVYSTIIINESNIYLSTINGNLTIVGELFALSNITITNSLTCSDLNVSNINVSKINGNLTIGNNLTVNNSIYADNSIYTLNLLLNNQILTTDPANNLIYNSNIILTVNNSNILNMSNIIIYDATNSQEVLLDVRGNIQCNAVFLTSNVNKKKNIRDLTTDEINHVSKIKSYNYDLKSSDMNNYGFLAHEVQNLYPMLSDGDSVNYIGFIPLLLEKVKIMENRINELERIVNNNNK
jgi:hypothetical protein